MTIDLNPHHLDTVRAILAEHVPDCEVMAFGSRAAWTAHERSDLDLAVACGGRVGGGVIARLREAFEESDLPIRVDVLDWHAIADSFRELIETDCVVVQSATPGGWRETTFGQCAVLVRDTVKPVDFEGMPYVGLEHIGEGTLSLIGVGDASTATSVKSRFRQGDILFGKLRPYFRKVVRARFDGLCSTDIWVVRPSEGIDAGYIFCVMASQEFADMTTRGSEGTKMPRARWEFVSRFPLRLPPLAEQRRIARTLGALDERIEENRRAGATLEEMARALFRHWFVEFGPVRAKVAGLPSGLPPALDALFPASFEASALRDVPTGWGVVPLGEAIRVNPPRRLRRGNVVPYVDLAALTPSGFGFGVAFADRPYMSGSRYRTGDTLMGRMAHSIERGKVALVDFLADDQVGWGSTEFIVLRPKQPWPPVFAYLLASTAELREHAVANVVGTTRQRAPAAAIESYMLARPPDDLVVAFGDIVQPWVAQASRTAMQSRVLAALRDTLLPRLVSGEVRTPG